MKSALMSLLGWYGLAELALLLFVLLLVALPAKQLADLAQGPPGALQGALRTAGEGISQRPWRAVSLVMLLAVGLRAAILPWLGAPAPGVHDEQSLMLQAQTYAAGRLANPTHPLWPHFESFHINQLPAYASMYFPGRGLPLAVGLWLGQSPWLGVWLSMVLMCMAVVWMLQAWVSAPLALLGGVIVVLRFGVFSYWVNSYWGGAFTALGALLVIGALPRVWRATQHAQRWRMGAVMGLGALILMTTRPFEGFLLCAPVAIALLVSWLRQARSAPGRGLTAWSSAASLTVPVLLLTSLGGATLLAYNHATTGQLGKTPYALNRDTYASAPAFLVSKPLTSAERGPAYFRAFYAEEAAPYARRDSLRGWAANLLGKLFHNWNFYLGPLLTVPFLLGLWQAAQRPHAVFVLGSLAFFAAGYALETWNFPHYTAPLLPLLMIVLMQGFEALRRAGELGLLLARALPLALAALLVLPLVAVVQGPSSPLRAALSNSHNRACCAIADSNLREQLQSRLQALPGPDLVLVKDGPHNPLHFELVYNDANIDLAPVVWARRLSPAQDAALQSYFAGRQQWAFEWRPDLPLGYQLEKTNE